MRKKLEPQLHSADSEQQVPNVLGSAVAYAVRNIPEGERLYRLSQVLSIVPVSRAKFLKMVNEGKAPQPIKCGRNSFYLASDIHKFISALIEASRSAKPFDIDDLVLTITGVKR